MYLRKFNDFKINFLHFCKFLIFQFHFSPFVADKTTCNEHNKLIISPPVSEVVRFANDSHFVTCSHKKGPNSSGIHWFNPRGKEISDKRGRVHIEDRSSQTIGEWTISMQPIFAKSLERIVYSENVRFSADCFPARNANNMEL
jgi:hypothetical protein